MYLCKNEAMKRQRVIFITAALFFALATLTGCAQNPENWTSDQLMDPAKLASEINAKNELPMIINVGPAPTIPNSTDIGSTKEKSGQKLLESKLKGVAKDKRIVIYCGCCPFEHCPNVRPAIAILKKMNFTNYYLLNLPHNIKTDWIDKGYPTSKL
jgi:rhodanese-related sulfurtransferase